MKLCCKEKWHATCRHWCGRLSSCCHLHWFHLMLPLIPMVITSSNIIYQAFPVLAMLTLSMVTTSQTMYLINFLVAFFFSRANSIISNRMHYCTAYRKSHANLYYIEQNLHNNISIKTSNRTLDAQKKQIPYLQIQIQHQKGVAEGVAAEDGWSRLPGITLGTWIRVLMRLDRDSELRNATGTCPGSSSMSAGRGSLS
ncbi:hypothetical protein PVAP13_9KG220100 [Panicum virgatum]|uniref:Uncharacterized protein n=1 Tax=Panicum virgatum TaxID=38727 RepID=A0A8T0NNF3_PANVG|nr:hypothetical protein PVAP13_9KG220100 [Panicum virgatum]